MARPRYIRHRKFNRIRHSRRLLKWLEEQATRLSVTEEALFNLMVGNRFSFQAVESLTTFPEVPENSVAPTITGTAEIGETLTVTPGTWSGEPTPTLTYQWYRDDGDEVYPIEGATDLEYEVTVADGGFTLFVREIASNRVGAMYEDSAPTAEVPEAEAPANTNPPVVSGDPEVGATLTATPGTWTGVPTPELTYQWYRNDGVEDTPIDGATGLTYELTAEDEGSVVFVRETAANLVGEMFVDSDPTATITEPA